MAGNQEEKNSSKAYHFKDIQELIMITNSELEDVLYIGQKINGRHCRSDFTFKTKEEASTLSKNSKARIAKNKDSDFFVYNEKTEELVPFKKNDYLMYDRGYVAFDGEKYFSYDDNGNEVGDFSFSNN